MILTAPSDGTPPGLEVGEEKKNSGVKQMSFLEKRNNHSEEELRRSHQTEHSEAVTQKKLEE